MRGLVSYLLAAFVVVMALDSVAPIGLGLARGAIPVAEGSLVQSVDRSHKADRLPVTTEKEQRAVQPSMLVGCDPGFSPLSVSARANFARRCIA